MKRNTTQLVGQPLDRVDGRLKVTGQALYAYDTRTSSAPAFGFIVQATIAKGRIASIDTTQSEAVAGVLLVLTHRNMPAQPAFGASRPERDFPTRFIRPRPCLADDRVRTWGEPVAFVVAETFEAARHASSLVRVTYVAEAQHTDLRAGLDRAYAPSSIFGNRPTDTVAGDFDTAFAKAPVTVETTSWMPFQLHNPMEPHASTVEWDGTQLTVHTSTQTTADIRDAIAATLQLPVDDVRVVAAFVGGGFGGKLTVRAETILASHAARALPGRPIKVAQTRQQMFHNTGHRPACRQVVKLAAERDGQLTGISHEVVMQSAPFEEFPEQTAVSTRTLYAAPHRMTRHRLVALDLQGGEPMRAPGEAPGLLALETAMDELATRLGIDPIELRVRNEPRLDPERGVPYSSRNLVRCMREGAVRFGWNKRPMTPASRREGRWLIGYGMAAGVRANYVAKAQASATLELDGRVTIRCDLTDIGTGTYTILTQIAADALGMPARRIVVKLGDTRFPRTPGSGGSWGAASAGSAVQDACMKLRAAIDRREAPSPEGLTAMGAVGGMADNPAYRDYSQHAFGAHFAEVRVDADSGEVRLRRMLGAFAAGRILNPKTARSQLIGGMTWGLSAALFEDAVVDPRFGQFVNHDLAEYHVPVHADATDIDAFFVDEEDDKGNPLHIKGIGELGVCGAGAAVANAVFNATGIRVRDFPITLDRLLGKLP